MNIVGYVRISRDEDRENYSSIESQQEIINNYASSKNLTVSKMYIDDNFSGYSFDRPAFNEMQKELEKGNIDIIIAKDLSRIGRHNARTQLFLEEIQELGKRLLLPGEGRGYDSCADDDDIIGIKTWFNEWYVKDISRKIKASMHARQRKGDLIMGSHYGYVKVSQDKSKLVVDEKVRAVIESIFKLYINGNGYKKICDILNEKRIPTPSQYIRACSAEKGKIFGNAVSGKWQTHNIQRIIQNDLYTGTLRTHKKQNLRIKGKQEKVPEDMQFVFENHHEPIIAKEDFELARQINNRRKTAQYRGKGNYKYIFSSFVFCGDCHFAATGKNIQKSPEIERGYECTQYAKYGLNSCVYHSVPESRILYYLKEFLKDIRSEYKDYLLSTSFTKKKTDYSLKADTVKKELDNSNEKLKRIISQKIDDIMSQKDDASRNIIVNSYVEIENGEKRKIIELTDRLKEIEEIDNENRENEIRTALELFDRIIEDERPERKLLELILDRIYIYHDKTIEFILRMDTEKLTHPI